ncbi:MAG: hypothetical protein NTV09_11065 [Bacteroidetes bacterium]|nr:hypothetical protein [Bacteroidota bacterium]
MKIIQLFLALILATPCLAQSPAVAPKQVKAIPAVNRNVSVTPPIDKIVGSPKEINKKKRKLVPVTAASKRSPVSLSKTN